MMSDEPNKKMDETLRAYARARRKGFNPSMPPATLARLRKEVDEVYSPEVEKRPVLARFWRHYGVALAACAVVAGGLILHNHPLKEKQMASATAATVNESNILPFGPRASTALKTFAESEQTTMNQPALEPAQKNRGLRIQKEELDFKAKTTAETALSPLALSAPKPVAIEQEVRLKEDKKPALDMSQKDEKLGALSFSRYGDAPSTASGTGAAPGALPNQAPGTPPRGDTSRLGGDRSSALATDDILRKQSESDTARLVAAENRAAGANDTLATRSYSPQTAALSETGLRDFGAALKQSYVAVQPVKNKRLRKEEAQPILAKFQLEQLGNSLRFIDADGSVYTGQITNQVPTNLAVTTAAETRQFYYGEASNSFGMNVLAYSFEAIGTNLTANQSVLVSGLYAPGNEAGVTNTPAGQSPVVKAKGGAKKVANSIKGQITGQVLINGTNQAPFKAISHGP